MKAVEIETPEIERLKRCGALPVGYLPSTELGWRLVRLRAKSIAEGGKLLSESELDDEVARLRE